MRRLGLACAASVLIATDAYAHVMPAHQGTLALRGRRAYLALSLPAALFRDADTDRDGKLSVTEAMANRELLERIVATRVHVADRLSAARLEFAQVIVERLDDDTGATPRPATDVLVLVVAGFDRDPGEIRLTIDGLDGASEGNADMRLTVRASRPDSRVPDTESLTLLPGHPTITFFAPAWRRAVDSMRLGVDHIMHGPDHMLFLLTLVLAGTGWRYWGSVISSFTIAHAAVLGFAAAGHAPPVPSVLAEAMIGASIVMMGYRVWRGRKESLGREACLAAACGLVHGLGIVDAVRALNVGGRPDLVTLAAFNGGVEVAQLCVLALSLLGLRAYRAALCQSKASMLMRSLPST